MFDADAARQMTMVAGVALSVFFALGGVWLARRLWPDGRDSRDNEHENA